MVIPTVQPVSCQIRARRIAADVTLGLVKVINALANGLDSLVLFLLDAHDSLDPDRVEPDR